MQRKDYTPTKSSAQLNINAHYIQAGHRQQPKFAGQMTIMREYEALKLQAKQLQIMNRQLATDAQKLRYQKSLNESKLLQKVTFQEQAMIQFQKQKNYELQMMRIKNDEDINRLKRDYQKKLEDMLRQIKSRQFLGKELIEKSTFLQTKLQEYHGVSQKLEHELAALRDSNSGLTQQVTREEFANKKLQMLAEQLERQKIEMEDQIHILLDIEAEKSRTIGSLETQFQQSQSSIGNLNQKLLLLTQNFSSLEQHISVMKESLLNAEMRGEELDRHIQSAEFQITERQQLLIQQRDREMRLRNQVDAHKQRESQRLLQIRELIAENERSYTELNGIRSKLYDVSIEQAIDI